MRASSMQIFTTIIVFAVLGALAGLGMVYSGIYNVAASDPHSAFTKWLFQTTMKHSVKRRAQNITVPELADSERIDVSVSNYEEMCAQCHSPPEEPVTDLAKGLNPKPPDLAESAQHLSAAEIFWIVKKRHQDDRHAGLGANPHRRGALVSGRFCAKAARHDFSSISEIKSGSKRRDGKPPLEMTWRTRRPTVRYLY
jgi:hypothetical protein